MANETLEKLETILNKHGIRPVDFWDSEVGQADRDSMLEKLEPMNSEQMEEFLVSEGYV